MKKQVKQLTQECVAILGITNPIRVRIRPGEKFHHPDHNYPVSGICDWHTSKGVVHYQIDIVAKTPRGLWPELLAHEIVHVYVLENHPKATMHGKTFQRMASRLRRVLRDLGYDLEPLYTKGLDV